MKAPAFWAHGLDPKSREAAPLTRLLLTPASWLYRWGFDRKLAAAKPLKVEATVICVGNLTVGGTGKTPLVAALRTYISNTYQKRCASLSRGYGGRIKTPTKVHPTRHSAAEIGDEALMLSNTGESWIGADRAATAEAMVTDGVEVILMDDGHQNHSLHKDMSFIVVDAAAPFGNGHILPKGPLREPILSGLTRADAVILLGTGPRPIPLKGPDIPVLDGSLMPGQPLPTEPLVAFAGIGRPQKFFDTLIALGGSLCEAVPFPDHHIYKPNDLKYLQALARDHDAQLITTEKDYARLTPHERSGILPFPIHVSLREPGALKALLDRLLIPASET